MMTTIVTSVQYDSLFFLSAFDRKKEKAIIMPTSTTTTGTPADAKPSFSARKEPQEGTTTTTAITPSSLEPTRQQQQQHFATAATANTTTTTSSMSVALLIYWVFPVLCIAAFGRFGVDTSVGTIPIVDPPNSRRHSSSRTTPSQSSAAARAAAQRRQQQQHDDRSRSNNAPTAIPSTAPSSPSSRSSARIGSLDTSNWPTAYKSTVSEISRRRKRWIHGPPPKQQQQQQQNQKQQSRQEQQMTTTSSTTITEKKQISSTTTTTPTTTTTRGASTDRQRLEWQDAIRTLRIDHEQDPSNIYKAIQYADAMRFFSLRYHDGGTYEIESIAMYDKCVALVVEARNRARATGLATNVNKAAAASTTTSSLYSLSINGEDDGDDYNTAFSNDLLQVADEATLDYTEKSLDGMLCGVYTAQGKNYFLANLFARAAEAYSHCLDDIEPNYLDARNNRASALIVMGDYEQAAADLVLVIQRDRHRIFTDAFMGLARILETKEEAVVGGGGWNDIVRLLEGELIPQFQVQWSSVATMSSSLLSLEQQQVKQVFGTALRRFHHVLFTYHDRKTKNYPEAWKHLIKSHSYKLSILAPWVRGSEMAKLNQIQQVFKPGFWPPEVGSDLQTPIFVVGFPRSGSTLLESVLDAHPQIVGTGENSVFNGRLDDIRNQIVRVSMTGQRDQIGPLTRTLAQEVVDEMQRLWEMRVQKTKRDKKQSSTSISSNDNGTNEQAEEGEVDEEKPRRFVDKMLTNYFNIGFIHMLYPKALILHVVREPMDTIFSAYKHEFPAGGLEYTSDMHALSELYLSYRQVMEHWDAVLPGRVTHIRYEDLVHDMPSMARAVTAATGLQWDDAVLDKRQDYHVNTMSATQIRKKVYKDSVKSWMRYQKELKDLIQLIGDRVDCDIETTLPNYSRAPPTV